MTNIYKTHCKTLAAALAAVLQLAALATVPLSWDVRPGQPAPASFDRYHGETLAFRCTFRGFGELPFEPGADIRLWYQTNGMGYAWWSAPATIQSNVLSAVWSPALDPGAERVSLFFGAPSNAYASAVLRLRHSPGFTPSAQPIPVQVFDFGGFDVRNAPYYTRAEADGCVAGAISTNNPAFVSAVLAVPLEGAEPNDLSELAEYGGYGTVGAAILALIAGLAALKRRMGAAEEAIEGKVSASELPYALVVPGEWTYSGSGYDPSNTYRMTWDAEQEEWLLNYYTGDIETPWSLVEVQSGEQDDLVVDFVNSAITATRDSLPDHLLDRAVNVVEVSGATTLTLPALEHAGKARDFLVRLEIAEGVTPNISIADPTGETLTYETDGDNFPVPDEAGKWLYSFTETAAHTFAVSLKKVNTVAVPQAQGGL